MREREREGGMVSDQSDLPLHSPLTICMKSVSFTVECFLPVLMLQMSIAVMKIWL